MAYNHGVKVSEKATSILPPVSVSAGIPFIVGTAPVNMTDPLNVNKPVLCSSYAEAVAAFGYVPPVLDATSGLKKYEYSISEFIYSQFALFGSSPVIIVNVLDPSKAAHKSSTTATAFKLNSDGEATIEESGIILSSLTVGESGQAESASGAYEGSGTDELEVAAVEAGAAGNSLSVSIKFADANDVAITVLQGGESIASGTITPGDSESITAEQLNALSDVRALVLFDGSILVADIPAASAESPITISLSGGADASGAYVEGEDYSVAFDDNGYIVITSLKTAGGEFKMPIDTSIAFSASKLNPEAITATDIIGGVDISGNKSGFELVDECFPRFRLVPGLLLAPGYSHNAGLAAVMAAKAANINQVFSAIALIDAPTDSVSQYSGVPEWKNTNNVVDSRQIVCWPGVALDGVYYHLSTQVAGTIDITDSENDDVPYVSPSNHNINATASVLADGSEVWIAPDTGAYLNGQGVVTALNFIGGWKLWGNRTACYPGNTDVKDSFIPVKRMFAWVGNTLIQTFWSHVDAPLNRRLIDTIIDSANLWLNGLEARQYIIGGRVEFLDTENPEQDLMDGIARFHVYLTPASPAREIDFILEYDPAYLETLFAA